MKVEDFVKLRQMTPSKHPTIHLETYAYCNAKCVFCGYPYMTRKKGKMSKELFHHIIEDMTSWDEPVEEIVPVHYGEFFLNPDWLDVLKTLQNRLPGTKIAIPTNGVLLDNNKISELVKIKNIHYINFSVYGCFDETYKRIMGLDPVLISTVMNAVDVIAKSRPDITIRVSTTNEPAFMTWMETEMFMKFWHPVGIVHNIVANRQLNKKFMRDYPCHIPCRGVFGALAVLWDGHVALCCFDPNGELIVGDVNKECLLDIWNGTVVKKYQRFHNDGMRDKIPLCKTCTHC